MTPKIGGNCLRTRTARPGRQKSPDRAGKPSVISRPQQAEATAKAAPREHDPPAVRSGAATVSGGRAASADCSQSICRTKGRERTGQQEPRLLCHSRRGGQGAGGLPGRTMEAAVRSEPLRWPALPLRASWLCDGGTSIGSAAGSLSARLRRSITKAKSIASFRCSRSCGRTWKPYATNCLQLRSIDSAVQRSPVITRYRDVNSNLRTQLLRIIAKARADAVAKAVPEPAGEPGDGISGGASGPRCRGWLGHSTAVAQKALLASDRRTTSTARLQAKRCNNPAQSGTKRRTIKRRRRASTGTTCEITDDYDDRCDTVHLYSSGRGGSRTRTGVTPQRILSP